MVLIYTFTVGISAGFKLFELRFDTFVLTRFCGVDVVDGESKVVVFAVEGLTKLVENSL